MGKAMDALNNAAMLLSQAPSVQDLTREQRDELNVELNLVAELLSAASGESLETVWEAIDNGWLPLAEQGADKDYSTYKPMMTVVQVFELKGNPDEGYWISSPEADAAIGQIAGDVFVVKEIVTTVENGYARRVVTLVRKDLVHD